MAFGRGSLWCLGGVFRPATVPCSGRSVVGAVRNLEFSMLGTDQKQLDYLYRIVKGFYYPYTFIAELQVYDAIQTDK